MFLLGYAYIHLNGVESVILASLGVGLNISRVG